MKKLLFAALSALLIASCAVIPYEETRSILDFRQYAERGFKISPAQTLAEPHDCLATIVIEAKSGVVNIRKDADGSIVDLTTSKEDYRGFEPHKYKSPNPDEILAKLVAYAKSIGANGMVDLKSSLHRINEGAGIQYVLTISGCAVKIKTEE